MTVESRLPTNEESWQLTMEHAPVATLLVSTQARILWANRSLREMLGYDEEQVTRLTIPGITHPDDLTTSRQVMDRLLSGDHRHQMLTKRYMRADGTHLTADLSLSVLRDDDGTVLYFIAQIVDVSDRAAFAVRLDAAEATLASERRRAEAVFDTVGEGLLLLDAAGSFQTYNSRLQDFLALAYPDGHRGVAGMEGFIYDAEQTRPLSREEMPSVHATRGEEFDGVLIWVGEDPTTRLALSVSARSVRDQDGGFTGSALAYHDVTALLRAVTVKEQFVASVSHELRTPLTAALAYLELLDGSEDLSDDARQLAVGARRNVLRLNHLVADLLFVTRASSGSHLIDPHRIDLAGVVVDAVSAARIEGDAAGIAVSADLPETLEVVGDELRLRQVVDNLLANAITYSDRGCHVAVTLVAHEATVELTVADNGDGIDEADMSSTFTRFFRGANAQRRRIPGTGLGLHIVHTIVEAHGGDVDLQSRPGEGTTVRVTLQR